MESFTRIPDIYIGIYIVIFFVIPWLVLIYWVVKFQFALKKVMGSAYWEFWSFNKAPRYASENKEFGEVFSKRNKCFVAVFIIWLVGFAVLAGIVYFVKAQRVAAMNSNYSLNPTPKALRAFGSLASLGAG